MQQLVLQSMAPALGVFIGALIGFSLRRRRGKTEGLMQDSVFLTASAAGGAALLVAMAYNYLFGAGA
ncbi:hypothetical protein [Thalassococcus sp. S3]|uniref:hypothetical protein n=1 Tax=Thalassococcus sp. S3 TaxID=2017482 RepID=UPI0020C55BFC|nr:hypothetical protein [Thalassococcus sp. S3]